MQLKFERRKGGSIERPRCFYIAALAYLNLSFEDFLFEEKRSILDNAFLLHFFKAFSLHEHTHLVRTMRAALHRLTLMTLWVVWSLLSSSSS